MFDFFRQYIRIPVCVLVFSLWMTPVTAVDGPARQGLGRTPHPGTSYLENSGCQALVLAGINELYSLNFDASEAAFTRVATIASNHPIGCVYLALTSIGRSLTEGEKPGTKARLHAYTEMAVNRSLRLQARKIDPWSRFYAGCAFILKSYLEGHRQNYITSLKWLKRGILQINRACENSETAADAKVLLGSYQYFTSRLPWYFRFFATLLIEPSNQNMGIENLEYATTHSIFDRTEAQMLLATAYSWDGQSEAAFELAESLSREFPENYCFAFLRQDIMMRQHNFRGALACATNRLARIENDIRPYVHGLLADQHYIIGLIQTRMKNYHSALTHFALAFKLAKDKPYLRAWAILRQGTVYDLMEKHAAARNCYAIVKTIHHKSDLLDTYGRRFSVDPYKGEPLE